jgi:DNA primase
LVRRPPYSDPGDQLVVIFSSNPSLQPQVSILDYLQQQGWKPSRDVSREEVAGLCPFHRETRPSFYVNRRKDVFYCHGCGRCGRLARLRQFFADAPTRSVEPCTNPTELMQATYRFYRQQLPHSAEAGAYLARRGVGAPSVIERMRIGYAPGGCLRRHLLGLGFAYQMLVDYGLIDERGRDRFFRRVIFPLEQTGNLYGRSIHGDVWRHLFLPGSKGGLYGWDPASRSRSIIVVEGLFDLASLWQAGFNNTVAVLGSHLNRQQLAQLEAAAGRRIYLCFDADHNGSGQHAADHISARLRQAGIRMSRVVLPDGQDPNSLLARENGVVDFQRCLEQAR